MTGLIRFDRPPVSGSPTWVSVTAWQGQGEGAPGPGLYVDHLSRVDATTYRLTEPAPIGGTWKTLVRVHDGRDLSAMPVFMPEDAAIDAPEVPAASGETRVFDEEHLILQRERKGGVAGWIWGVAGLVVLVCSGVLVAALGWGVSRYGRSAARAGEPDPVVEPDSSVEPGLSDETDSSVETVETVETRT